MSERQYADQFVAHIRASGIVPAEDVAEKLLAKPGEIIRFRCEGDRKGRRNGYAILYLGPYPAGAFGNWSLGIKGKWKAEGCSTFSPDILAVYQRRMIQQDQRQAQMRQVARIATDLLNDATYADPDHPYLRKKQLMPANIFQIGRMLLVPMTDVFGKLWDVQRIGEDGFKTFLPGPRRERTFWSVGIEWSDDAILAPDTIYIGEGVATMLALYNELGQPVVAAMDAHSLEPCARAVRNRFPTSKITVCADDDAATAERVGRNPGLTAAEAAAAAVGGWLAVPRRAQA
jgi:putative DNA primase/helicase